MLNVNHYDSYIETTPSVVGELATRYSPIPLNSVLRYSLTACLLVLWVGYSPYLRFRMLNIDHHWRAYYRCQRRWRGRVGIKC